jgi:dipeptidyl aminopeptidase/acylaminoacyl peptidase
MTDERLPSPRSVSPWPALAAAILLGCLLLVSILPARAQDKPLLQIDEDCPAFDIAADGRIVYAVRHVFREKVWDLQRDDIWVVTPEGKKTRIVNGEKLVKSRVPFSYAIQATRWSPDGQRLTVEMITSEVIDQEGNTREALITDLMDAAGKEIEISGTHNSVIPDAAQATWLADGATVAFLTEAVKPKLLFSIAMVRPVGGRGGPRFVGRTFSTVVWSPKESTAVAIERDQGLSGPIQLVWLDLIKETRREIATLDGYLGQLSLSPSGRKVAYFRDGDTLEIRDLAKPGEATRVTVAYGRFEWAPDERRVLLKRGPEKKTGDLAWVGIPGGTLEPVLHGLGFHWFEISPDGRWLAVTQPGKRNLLVYPLP